MTTNKQDDAPSQPGEVRSGEGLGRTRWFGAKVKPARAGWYEVTWLYDGTPEVWFNYWNGKAWHWGCQTMAHASKCAPTSLQAVHHIDAITFKKWRGLCRPNAKLTGP